MATPRSSLKKRGKVFYLHFSESGNRKRVMRCSGPIIDTTYLEQITVARVSDFVREYVQRYGIQAKTANRYREVLHHV